MNDEKITDHEFELGVDGLLAERDTIRAENAALREQLAKAEAVRITEVSLVREGRDAVVYLQQGGERRVAIKEQCDGLFSHALHESGISALADHKAQEGGE